MIYLFIYLFIYFSSTSFERNRYNNINLQPLIYYHYLLSNVLFFVGFSFQETSSDLGEKNIGMLSIPSTSHGISNSSDLSISTESVYDDNDDDEGGTGSFNTQKLFSFAWQIAKGMVGIDITT